MYQDPISSSRDDRYMGYRALWLKVVVRAVFDYVTYKDCSKLDKKRLADTAETWLFKPNICFNGFENICRMLDIDPDRVRERALSLSQADVDRIKHYERVLESQGPRELLAGFLPGRTTEDEDD
jgi:thymidylate synthase ThyX